MSKEILFGRGNSGTKLAENYLRDMMVVSALIAPDPYATVSIIASAVAELDSVGQKGFLRTLFQHMASEGGIEVTNRRDAAFTILTEAMTPLVKTNQPFVCNAYISAVQAQTGKNDPFCGSIYTLLEVGKAIAPYFSKGIHSKKLITAWTPVIKEFSREGALKEKVQIHLEVEEIKERISSTDVT